MAIHQSELRIINLFEANMNASDIAAETGLSLIYVRDRISQLCVNVGPDRKHQAGMARGSRMLLTAIRRERKYQAGMVRGSLMLLMAIRRERTA